MKVNDTKLDNGFGIEQMMYKQGNRSKKIMIFLIVAVIVAALAFTACFFALEISRTKQYNANLHNSIIESPTQTENNPEEITPVTPSTPESGSGSNYSEGETNDPPASSSTYAVVVQAVWGITGNTSTTSSFNYNYVYSLDTGIAHSVNTRGYFWLTINNPAAMWWNVNKSVDLWQGRVATAATPNYVGGDSYTTSNGERDNKNNAVAVRRSYYTNSSNFTVTANFSGMGICNKDFVVSFMTKDADGTMRDINNIHNIYPANTTSGSVSLNLSDLIASGVSGSTQYVYAVITKKVDINVSYGTIASGLSKNINITYKVWGGSETTVNTYLTKINAYNCVFGAVGSYTCYNDDIAFNGSLKKLVEKNYDIIFTFSNGLELKIANGKAYGSISYNDSSGSISISKYYNFTNLQAFRRFTTKDDVMDWLWGSSVGTTNSNIKRSDYFTYGSNYQGFELGSEISMFRTGGANYFYLNSMLGNYLLSGGGVDGPLIVNVVNPLARMYDYTDGVEGECYTCMNFSEMSIAGGQSSDAGLTSNLIKTVNIDFYTSAVVDDNWALDQGINASTVNITAKNNAVLTNVNDKHLCFGRSTRTVNIDSSVDIAKIFVFGPTNINGKVGKIDTTDATLKINTGASVGEIVCGDVQFASIDIVGINFNGGSVGKIDILANYNDSAASAIVTLAGENLNSSTNLNLNYKLPTASSTTNFPLKINSLTNLSNLKINIERVYEKGVYYLINSTTVSTTFQGVKSNITSANTFYELKTSGNFITFEVTNTAFIKGYDKATYGVNSLESIAEKTSYDKDVTYVLTCDITIPYDAGFKGIGSNAAFNGVFDGQGYSIQFEQKYTYVSGSYQYLTTNCGLFYQINSAEIKNLILYGTIKTPFVSGGINYYYGLAFRNLGITKITNLYNTITISNPSTDIGPAVQSIYQNHGSLTFTNCAAMGSVARCTEDSHERSAFVGYNVNSGTVSFQNCAANGSSYKNNVLDGKNGVFVGWSTNSGNVSFTNCFLQGTYNPVIGEYNKNTTNTSNVNVSSSNYIVNIESKLNTWINNSYTGSEKLYYWENGYMKPFELNSVTDLIELAGKGTNFAYRTLKITSSDDVLTVTNWNGFVSFAGVFLGNNKTINITGTQGLIKSASGTIKNLTITGTITGTSIYVGGISGRGGTITNCNNYATITSTGSYTGGICGYNTATITNCNNYGVITGKDYTGGISGYSEDISNSTNYGSVNGATYVGGIAGQKYAVSRIEEVVNEGDVTGKQYVGGIVGYSNNYTSTSYYIKNAINYGSVTGTSYIGGITGYVYYNSKPSQVLVIIQNSNNFGNIIATDATEKVGGILGYSYFDHYGVIKDCVADCDIYVNANTTNVGGISGGGSVNNCVFKGTLYSNDGNELKSSNVTFATHDGNVTNFIFIGKISSTVTGVGEVVGLAANGSNSGFSITTGISAESTATRCFIQNYESKILISPLGFSSQYTGCSTFKNINTSLVYNGIFFGYVWDALEDSATTPTTYYKMGEEGYPIVDTEHTARTITLNIVEVDNLNAINNMVVTNGIPYDFSGTTLFFDNGEDGYALNLSHVETIDETAGTTTTLFTGLGGGTPIINGNWQGITDKRTNITIGNYPLFNNVQDATIQYLNIYSEEGKTSGYSLANTATSCLISNCTNYANLTGDNFQEKVGGLIISAQSCTITNCENRGNITTNITSGLDRVYMGGIVAYATSCSLENCVNYGNIDTNGYEGRLGGMIGEAITALTANNCANYGALLNGGSIGGIVGLLNAGTYTIANCYTNCEILSKTNAAGIIGVSQGTVSLINCITSGIYESTGISGTARVSGVVANSTSTKLDIENCVSFATIKNDLNSLTTTGIAYQASGTTQVGRCYFFGDIISSSFYVITNSVFVDGSGYNINNTEIEGQTTEYIKLIYIKETNPVWSTQAYIKLLFETETESILNGTNEKLVLSWAGINAGFDITFFINAFNKELTF